MDPNANLAEQLALAKQIIDDDERQPVPHDGTDAHRLAELVLALDEWRHRGGFLPARWELCKHCGANPAAYPGAVYCGAGCTARAGA